MAKKKQKKEMCLSPTGRGSFVHLAEAVPNYNGDGEEKCLDILFPKGKVDLKQLKTTYTEMCKYVFDISYCKNRPWSFKGKGKVDKAIIKDGDERYEESDPDSREIYEPYIGHYYMTVRRDCTKKDIFIPVVDRDQNPLDEDDFKSGDFFRVVFEMSAYWQKKHGPQVSLKLVRVQKVQNGDALSTGERIDHAAATEMMDSDDIDTSEWGDDYIEDEDHEGNDYGYEGDGDEDDV
jgi:hypothetical protein